MIIVISGPSGAGKSSMGHYLAQNLGYRHFEFDNFVPGRPPVDPVDDLGIRTEWNALQRGDAQLFEQRHGKDVVITIPGGFTWTANDPIARAVRVRYLVGPAWVCLREFELRERALRRGLTATHWMANNQGILNALSTGHIPSHMCVNAFDSAMDRRADTEIAADLLR